MNDESLVEQLSTLGFSPTESEVYLAALETNEAQLSTIANNVGHPTSEVRETVRSLSSRGFVNLKQGDTDYVTTVRPETAFDALEDTLTTVETELETRFYDSRSVRRAEEPVGESDLFDSIREHVEEAHEEILVSIPGSMCSRLEETLADARDRGVLVLLLVTDDCEDDTSGYERMADLVRRYAHPSPLLLSVDQSAGLLAQPTDDGYKIYSLRGRDLVANLEGTFFNKYWLEAEQMFIVEPDPLPQTFSSFRHALLQAALYWQAGNPVRAIVKGVPVDGDGNPRTISGHIEDINQQLVAPETNDVPGQDAFELDTKNGTVSVGGRGAYLEDYEAHSIQLEEG